MNDMLLLERCEKFIRAYGTPITRFARMVGVSASALYKWKRNNLVFSDRTMERINDFLTSHGF